jgi:two-component system phosphate regulon sensor histidine kinase PhoR
MLVGMSDQSSYESLRTNKKISFSSVVNEAIEKNKVFAKEEGVVMEASVEDGIFVVANANRIAFAVDVLIRNAITYSIKNGIIKVDLKKDAYNKAVMAVVDNGIGISKNEQKFIFNKFFRGIRAQGAHTEGFGIGLSISQKIIESFAGEISMLSDGEDKGSAFTITLPVIEK